MSTVETPAAAPSPEASWTLGTALLFVVLWIVVLLLIQTIFTVIAVALVALTQGIDMENAMESFQAEAGLTARAVAAVGCVGLSWAATFALISRMLKRFPALAVRKALGLQPANPGWSVAVGIPVGLALLIAGEILMRLLNVSEDAAPIMELMKTPWGAASVAFMALAIAPIAEEIFFRGFVFPPMARRFSLGTAMAFNGGIFAAVHLLTYGQEFGYLPPIFLLGFVLSGLRAWTGSVVPPIVAHFVFNATSLVLFLIVGPETPTGI